MNIILDYRSGNHRRHIDVSNLAAILEEKQPEFTETLMGLHARGVNCASSFFEKCSEAIHAAGGRCINIDLRICDHLCPRKSTFQLTPPCVWLLYGTNNSHINEARYDAFMRMSGGSGKEPLARIKKINCASCT